MGESPRRPPTKKKAPPSKKPLNKGQKHRIFPVHYSPGKKLFHVVVRLSDAPGSFSSILKLLHTKVNLVGTSTYTLSDGTAVFSASAEALSGDVTREEIESLIEISDAAIESKVNEGRDGLLVDTFHSGFTVAGDDYLLLRRAGLNHMFDRVSKILGSGGEALLYEEGAAMGRSGVAAMAKTMGTQVMKDQVGALVRVMSAQGLGEIRGADGPVDGGFTVTVDDCFECSKETPRRACSFMRGYFAGAAEAIFLKRFEAQEPKCALMDSDHCEFTLVPTE